VDSSFRDRFGPWVFVAGASMGIGAAFSHQAAARGLNVVMLARGRELLEATAADVAAAHGVETRTIAADLADPDIARVVSEAITGLDVGLFVYNAAVAPHGYFVDTDLELQQLSVTVNCTTLLTLLNLLVPPMAERGRGGVGLVSSLGGISGAVKFGTYNAAKAYQWILGESLWTELGERGVDVSTVMVGATSSPNYNSFQATLDPSLCDKADTDSALDRARWRLMHPSTPDDAAIALYDHLGKGPVCYASPDDAWVAQRCLASTREESVAVWRGLQETSLRAPDRIAR
jgi:short-subunit dehydrogenase